MTIKEKIGIPKGERNNTLRYKELGTTTTVYLRKHQ